VANKPIGGLVWKSLLIMQLSGLWKIRIENIINSNHHQEKRMNEEKILFNELEMAGIRKNTNIFKNEPIFPPAIGITLTGIDGEGLHNITARRLKHSPELIDFPHTKYGVPILTKMTDDEKKRFYKLLGR